MKQEDADMHDCKTSYQNWVQEVLQLPQEPGPKCLPQEQYMGQLPHGCLEELEIDPRAVRAFTLGWWCGAILGGAKMS